MVAISNQCIEVEGVADLGLQEFYSYWNKRRGDRIAPSWSEIELIELPARILPYLTVVEVHRAPLDFVYTFYGTGHLVLKGRDLTGLSVSLTQPEELASVIFEQYVTTLDRAAPTAFRREVSDSGAEAAGVPTLMDLRLPLSADGKGIHWIMSLSNLRDSPAMRNFYEAHGRTRPPRRAALA